jgi:peptidoglycan/LPS O-acetylase OafA/YrhL
MTYRPYIDGLRAIAVLAVILFHFGCSALPGGFVGVDVFFVISGFLITQLLSQAPPLTLPQQLGEFYVRRARRILPALLVVSLTVAVTAAFVYLPGDLARVGRYLVFTPLMLSNVANLQDGGYFATTGSAFFPLNHFWSLAVEEQFYIVYPLFFLRLARTRPHRVIAALALVGAISLALSIRGELRHSVTIFYLAPARAWELMLGALAARCPTPRRNPRLLFECLGLLCLGVVLLAGHALVAATGFPNPLVALPCAATALLLYLNRQRSMIAAQLLALPPLVFTGRISYSLYLWHVPVLAFAQYYAIRPLSLGMQIAVGAAIFALALLSGLCVENPIRRRILLSSDRALLGTLIGGCVLVGIVGAWFWIDGGLPWRFSRELQTLTHPEQFPPDTTECMTLPPDRIAAGTLCHYGARDPAAGKVVLWGDSHALALLPAFAALASARGLQLNFAARSSCLPLTGAVVRSSSLQAREDCAAFNAAMLAAIRHIHPQVTILSGFWGLDEAYVALNPAAPPLQPATTSDPDWEATLQPLRAAGSSVCVVLDVPYLPYFMPYALAMAQRRQLDTDFVHVEGADIRARYAPFENSARARASHHELTVVDPKDVLCSAARCNVEFAGRSLYRDGNHLSEAGAMRVAGALARCLPQAVGPPR